MDPSSTTSTVRKRNNPNSPTTDDSSSLGGMVPRTLTSPSGLTRRGPSFVDRYDDGEDSALSGVSGRGLLEGELRSDYVLQNSSQSDLGTCIGNDSYLTLLDEVVLLGLKDQQGYLSFMNDSISYVLRGCILMELALRRRIRVVRDATRRRAFPDRYIEVIDASRTGEVILDEALKMMKSERHSIGTWIDLMSGETWNPLKVGYQLKQVRERVAKGLVDKGVLRTEKHSFLLFDMATHPVANGRVKEELVRRTVNTCMGRGQVPSLRAITLVCAASAANVLEGGVMGTLSYADKEAAFNRVDEFIKLYSSPSEKNGSLPSANEIVAGVLTIFSRLDSLLY